MPNSSHVSSKPTPQIGQQDSSHLSQFSGSYECGDVRLLLDMVGADAVNHVNVTQKEALIQAGDQHYSDMLTLEEPPSIKHRQIYRQALKQGKLRMAIDVVSLAHALHGLFIGQVSNECPLVLISLVRAGLPLGVLLQRALSDTAAPYTLPSTHYGMSIIRDRGLDSTALAQVLAAHQQSPIVFVDGWTGKGAIHSELQQSLMPFAGSTHPYHASIFHQGSTTVPLLTLADPAGVTWLSASGDDWLIPSGLLGSTVSGLISRTLYTPPEQGRHQSVYYDDLKPFDDTQTFIQTIEALRPSVTGRVLATHNKPRYQTQFIVDQLAARYDILNRNRIKPTIAEATRAVMRRDPERVLLASHNHPDTVLLRHLCQKKNIGIDVVGRAILPYQAVTLIKKRT